MSRTPGPVTPTGRSRLRQAVACGCAVIAALVAVAACGGGPPRPAPGPARVLSNYERTTGNAVRRDCGYSSPLPGRPGWSLWLFCDTAIASGHGGRTEHLILGTDTAAIGPYQAGHVPSRLSEIPTPPTPLTLPSTAAPEPFLPGPQGLVLPDSSLPCTGSGAYPASWISGAAREPGASPNVLISYDNYCVSGDSGTLTAESFGLVEYNPAANTLGLPTGVFGGGAGSQGLPLPAQQVLGSPVFAGDGYLYLFGFCRTAAQTGPLAGGCGQDGVFVARTLAQPAYWQNSLTYQYWTGLGWSADPIDARSVLPGGRPLGVSVGDYTAAGHGLVMIEQTSLAGAFQVWQARSPTGPWRRILTGKVPCSKGTERGTEGLCRAVIGHPELSTRSKLLVSYFDPGNNHVDVSAYPW
jgi:hypothetical protein